MADPFFAVCSYSRQKPAILSWESVWSAPSRNGTPSKFYESDTLVTLPSCWVKIVTLYLPGGAKNPEVLLDEEPSNIAFGDG